MFKPSRPTTDFSTSKPAKSLEVEVKEFISDGGAPISIISFFKDFKFACDVIDFHEGSVIRLLACFMKSSAWHYMRAKVDNYMRGSSSLSSYWLTSSPKVISYLLSKYATEHIIADVDKNLAALKQGHSQSPIYFACCVAAQTRGCRSIYLETKVITMFIVGL